MKLLALFIVLYAARSLESSVEVEANHPGAGPLFFVDADPLVFGLKKRAELIVKAGEKQQKPGSKRVEVDIGPEEGEVVEEVSHLHTYFGTEISELSSSACAQC